MFNIDYISVANDIVLNEITEKYIDDLYEMLSDEETAMYIISRTHSSIDDTKAFYNKIKIQQNENKSLYFGIYNAEEDKLIGFIALHRFDDINKRVKIGYALNKKYQKKGFMKKPLNKLVSYVFENTNFIRIEATVNPNNSNSYKLLESCGFLREGMLRMYSYNERTGTI